MYYNEILWIFLIFVRDHVIPEKLTPADFLEERFEYALQLLDNALKKIRSKMALLTADRNNILRSHNKVLEKKRNRGKKVPAQNKAVTKNAVCFGQCWLSPNHYITNTASST